MCHLGGGYRIYEHSDLHITFFRGNFAIGFPCKKSKKFLPAKNHFQRFANMTKKKVKEERRNLLDKYSIPMSEIPDKDLKDNKGWVWLKDLIDY